MRWYAVLRMRVGSLLHRRRLDAELEEELRGHIEREAEQAGAAEAWRRFAPGGGLDAVRDACREARGWTALENFVADFRRAARRLASSPGFGLTAIAVLTLGVAAATAMFSVCDAVLLEPLPGVASAAGLVHLERYDKNVLLGDFSYPDYLDYRDQSRSYAALAATSNFEYDIRGRNGTETVNAEMVSANYFQALGLGAERGRLFRRGDNRAVVVSDRYWRSRLGANPDAIGGTLTANQTALTVIGVAAPGFHGATQTWDADLWVPITLQPLLSPMGATGNCLATRNCGWVTIFGRLKTGVSLARAQAEAATVAARVAAAHPKIAGRRAAVVPGLGSWSDDRATQARFLAMLLAGTLLLAAMTSASLGSLFLARMGGRQQEVVTQLALGASRWRVARQFGFEAVLVAAPGAALGAAFAAPLARR